jgi:hypothetical protein
MKNLLVLRELKEQKAVTSIPMLLLSSKQKDMLMISRKQRNLRRGLALTTDATLDSR